jgi:hypothetical protein
MLIITDDGGAVWPNALIGKIDGVALTKYHHLIALDEFPTSALFHGAVDIDFPGLDQDFGLAAGVGDAGEFEELIEFDVLFGDGFGGIGFVAHLFYPGSL